MSATRLQIVILSRDRPQFLREALGSALAQDAPGVEVIVSDNSEHEDVARMLAAEFPAVRCVRRRPSLQALVHFRKVIEETSAEYVVLFHDDDRLDSDYARRLMAVMDADPDLAAVCCDARVLRDGLTGEQTVMGRIGKACRFDAPEQLLAPYMSFMAMGPAPFPGYLYRRRCIEGLYLDPREGGKYSDVSFLVRVVSRGAILWLPQVLMSYRVHDSNDGRTEAVGQRLRLLRFLHAHTGVARRSMLHQEFRFRFWLRWFREGRLGTSTRRSAWRERAVIRFLVSRGLRLALRPSFWLRILHRVARNS